LKQREQGRLVLCAFLALTMTLRGSPSKFFGITNSTVCGLCKPSSWRSRRVLAVALLGFFLKLPETTKFLPSPSRASLTAEKWPERQRSPPRTNRRTIVTPPPVPAASLFPSIGLAPRRAKASPRCDPWKLLALLPAQRASGRLPSFCSMRSCMVHKHSPHYLRSHSDKVFSILQSKPSPAKRM
jgi:hypothetical protein